ncbi:sensor histidine kinase [Ichthyenterobacterium sp. W332]|uniref:histidine kinase n=1 Tax=Microcosmobacter mediterraneus TaxID=3075607 RepID=A0ABU2YLB9_9FLAO|nr:sensor histidine kinase [Ichthyenterobacterium sp. W332]MDT0558954.1 sensor histidine kinase [Ichthyenterobacterium sp. W332]
MNINKYNIRLATKLNDSSSLKIVYTNLGGFHNENERIDSAYYYFSKALKLHRQTQDIEGEARILTSIADIQETEKDYIGAEENAVKAIRLFNKLEYNDDTKEWLWRLNNLIAIVSLKLKDFDKALEYHKKAQDIAQDMEEGYYNNLYSINNMAIAYRFKGEIEKSIELYEQVINEDSLDYYDSSFYVITLGNLAYTKSFKPDRDIKEIKSIFRLGDRMSDTINDPLAKLGIAIDLSKFYLDIEDRDSALYFAERSYKISDEISNNELKLQSLDLLAELNEGEKGKRYFREHIRLSDSLLNVERNRRNKFARIRLETDELEAENEKFSQQKLWLGALSGLLLLALTLGYIVITQRAKNKELKFVQDQQKANEEIYNLMLSQQDKVDEARANEKKRISQDLHDGVLGRLFGTRLSLDSLSFSEGKEAVKSRMQYIGELKIIEEDIRKISHDLNTDFVAGSGFTDILSELIEKQTKAYQLTYDFDYSDEVNWEFVDNKTKINIYRVIQESMQNIYKHAQANHIKIGIGLKNNVICIRVTDDGVGFDTNKSKKGIGLKNINSRINELRGQVDFSSQIGKGTTVDINIPYET